MKRSDVLILVLVLVSVFLASGIVGCGQEAKPTLTPTTSAPVETTETKGDTPVFRNDEVCALVYNYLNDKVTSMTDATQRIVTLQVLNEGRPHFSATYQGNGRWVVLALGIGEKNWTYNGGLWSLYETSTVIEPANDQATKLMMYIQSYAR